MNGDACRRSGCGGAIEDGYCNVCGHAETRTMVAAPVPAATPASTSPWSERAPSRAATQDGAGKPSLHGTTGRSARGPRQASRHTARRQLGAGLISLPELPSVEPERALLLDARVPERKRFCAKCDAALRRETGFCGKCGTRYSFVPSLKAGDLVANQYEVRGPIAFGGLGWIYLAFDRLLSRYVVLKGLLNAQDASAAAAAVAERRFLAAVKHPSIVSIYNFVQAAGEGFIVMEYIGGKTLKQIRQERGPLPPAEAMAYIHRVLPAFGYLHRQGLVFCDFKPDNIMLEHDDVKLIDLGGVRSVDDPEGDIYGTVGYSAPEAGAGPTPLSDLFTVGRTLAVLLTDIAGFSGEHKFTLPSPEQKLLFAEQTSLYRFLLKATAERAEDRFGSAEEMSEQLLGVMREVVALESGLPRPAASSDFGVDFLAQEAGDPMVPVLPDPCYLPAPTSRADDPGAQALRALAGVRDAARRVATLRVARQQFPQSREVRLQLAAALSQTLAFAEAERLLEELSTDQVWDWRVLWYQAQLCLWRSELATARQLFDQVSFELPGELAPKLALALVAELGNDLPTAVHFYDLVSRVDPAFVSAVFGLARCQRRMGDRGAAVATLSRMAPSSALFMRAQVEATRTLLDGGNSKPQLGDVLAASVRAEALPLDDRERVLLHKDLFRAALEEIGTKRTSTDGDTTMLGRPLAERPLRLGLEGALRAAASFAEGNERIRLVDEANQVRPRSWF